MLISDRYSLDISIPQHSIAIQSPWGEVRANAATEDDIRRYGPIFISEIGVYPSSFVKATNINQVVLCRDLQWRSLPVGGVPGVDNNTLYLEVARGSHVEWYERRVIHHELFHFVDYFDNGVISNGEQWETLNDESFQYGHGGWSLQFDSTASLLSSGIPGFLNRYSTSGVKEDKAEVFAHMIVDYGVVEERATHDAVLHNKVQMMKDLVLRASPDMNAEFWGSLPVRPRRRTLAAMLLYAASVWLCWLVLRKKGRKKEKDKGDSVGGSLQASCELMTSKIDADAKGGRIVRERYAISWACSFVAGIWSSLMLAGLFITWGDVGWRSGTDAASLARYFTEAVLTWAFPAVLSLTALASSEGRPRGRIGFFPLMITAIGLSAWLIKQLAFGGS